jgi:UDP-3-O-[3-hydroxymyristoyl] glucosamine N-acyltransferase
MEFNVERIVPGKSFFIKGTSYIGRPRSNTAMYITKKVEHLLSVLNDVKECLIFAEKSILVSEELEQKHAVVLCDRPQCEYAKFANLFEQERIKEESKFKYVLQEGGYYVSEDVTIPSDAYIEPNCVIGPDVHIGANARILAGSTIKYTTVGNGFLSNQYAVIGANGFTMADDENGNKLRIPTLGRVIIGNRVEVGVHDNISCGSAGDTIIEDCVKLDAFVHIGHDAHLHKNVEITAGAIIGGFDELEDYSYVGLNSTLRNRISLGENAFIGMGSTVTKSVDANVTVVGNPAKPFVKSS